MEWLGIIFPRGTTYKHGNPKNWEIHGRYHNVENVHVMWLGAKVYVCTYGEQNKSNKNCAQNTDPKGHEEQAENNANF